MKPVGHHRDRITEVNVPLLGKVAISSLWDLVEISLGDHAHLRFAQRVMNRDEADSQTRARCVEYLRLATIVPSLSSGNLCTARLERRGVLIEFIIAHSGRVATVVTNGEDDAHGVRARANLIACERRLTERKTVRKSRAPRFSRGKSRFMDSRRS